MSLLHDSVSTSCIAIAMDDCDDDSTEGSDMQSHPHKSSLKSGLVVSSGFDVMLFSFDLRPSYSLIPIC